MPATFLTAEWRKLAMANYVVDSAVLLPYLPYKTEIDLWNGTCYVSLVGFIFLNTKLKGISIPFHSNFEEVNLRFYVRYQDKDEWKRGVVFIKEIVPKPALTWVANTIYKEKYETMPMAHEWRTEGDRLHVSYSWKKTQWHKLSLIGASRPVPIGVSSEEEFITEHFWGYTKINNQVTSEYGVEHLRWEVYPINQYEISVDFGLIYGADFSFLTNEKPKSVFLAEGSAIVVKSGTRIS
jgi:uncharacterized protein YqjF (DUF2071 family)